MTRGARKTRGESQGAAVYDAIVSSCCRASSLASEVEGVVGSRRSRRPTTRLVQAQFDRVEVLGPSEAWLLPSVGAEAGSWAAELEGTATAALWLHFVRANAAKALRRSADS